MAFVAGTRLGRYEIRSLLGRGGMGEVYLALDTQLERTVALKVLPADVASDRQRMRRFVQEAKAASSLNHQNILTIYEFGQADATYFIATEFVDGVTLRQHITRAQITLNEVLDIGLQIAAALAAAHRAGIAHRDIKPENIMVRHDGFIKVLDFGLAKLTEPPATAFHPEGSAQTIIKTEAGVLIGTVNYMSPEQARGLKVDTRTDIWSLGVVLYEMVAGHAPFKGETGGDLIVLILTSEPAPLSRTSPAAPVELERIVTKALTKDRDARYQIIEDLIRDLKDLKRRLKFDTELDRSTLQIVPAGDVAVSAHQKKPATTPPESATQQRKQVTVLYANLFGLMAMTDTLDAEEVGDMMNALWQRLDTAIINYGGLIDKRMGTAVMALWGVEATQEDDPERAIRAALAMQAEVKEFLATNLRDYPDSGVSFEAGGQESFPPLMRIGINTGPALLGAVGLKGEFTAMGATVNLAHSLEQASPDGGILISHDTYRHTRGIFDVRALGTTSIKGRAEPVKVYVVERAKPRAFRLGMRGVEGVETRMIGRKAELERLMEALQTVLEDRKPQVVTVFGDAGIGKSRLLFEFRKNVDLLPDRVRVFHGRASEAMRGLPYSLVRDVLSFRFEIQDSDSVAVARDKLEQGMLASSGVGEEAKVHVHFIGHLIGLDFSTSPHLAGILDDAKQIRDRAFHSATQFFSAVSRDAPVVLYLEDLQWADDGSLDFVDYIARSCGSAPILILCFARPLLLERRPVWGEGQAEHMRLSLQPLSKRESRQLLDEILRRAESIPRELHELVVSRAEGNPFYTEELIKMLIDQKVILPGADEWRVDASQLSEARVPSTLTGVLQARLDGLSSWEKAVLQRASVVGRDFWDSAVEQVGDESAEPTPVKVSGDVRSALEALRRKELIYRREASAFEGTSEYTFKHALLRDVTYESVLKSERRKYHHEVAEWLIERSGERVNGYAGSIAEHYEHASEMERAAGWYGRAGRQAREAYTPETAVNYYRKALAFLPAAIGDDRQRASQRAQSVEWYEGLGEALWMQARYAEALEAYTAMRSVAESAEDIVAQARAWNGLALVQGNQGDNHAMLESAKSAERLAQTGGDSPPAITELASALIRQSWALHRLGDAAAMMTLARQAFMLSTKLGEDARREQARSLQSLGVAHQMLGHFDLAYNYIEQALALFRELGDRRLVANMLNSLGETARLRGDYGFAFSRYQEALTIAREIGNRAEQIAYLGNLGAVRIELRDYRAAETDLRQAIKMAGAVGYFGLSENYRFLAEALLEQGEASKSLEAAQQALVLGQETENQEHIGGAWRALGLVAARAPGSISIGERAYDARACFAESLRVFIEMDAEAERARSLREWARYEWEQGDRERGRALWQQAREIFTRLSMRLEVERMANLSFEEGEA
jgi:serine/threonine protein kinase/tetratricopeptide (TPR) repeat protein